MGIPAALPGGGWWEKAPKANKRRLANGTDAEVTKKAKTPNLSGSKCPKPTTRAKSRAVQPPNVATASTSTSNRPCEANATDVASRESHPKVPKEIQVSWAKSEQTPQELRDETGCESRLGCSSGSGLPSGLHTEGVQIESISEPGSYDVFVISSDSDDLVSLCESFTKTRSATKRAAPVESPQKPDLSLSLSNQSWPPRACSPTMTVRCWAPVCDPPTPLHCGRRLHGQGLRHQRFKLQTSAERSYQGGHLPPTVVHHVPVYRLQ